MSANQFEETPRNRAAKKRCPSLKYSFVEAPREIAEKLKALRSRVSDSGSSPGDISGYDERYGFSCSWEWEYSIPIPENWDGNPIPVELSVRADDLATLTLGAGSVSASYDKVNRCPGENSAIVALMPGVYNASLEFTNIDYNPPSGNVAVLSYGISAGRAGTIVPADNSEEPKECECSCGGGDEGGAVESSESRFRARGNVSADSAEVGSSAGKNSSLETNETFARWRTSFGAFRGLGGISSGALEILAYSVSEIMGTPADLEYRHPLASWLVVPENGVSAGAQFKHCTGASYTSWLCDGAGETFFKIGLSKKKTSAARWNANKTGIEILFPDKSSATYSATSGEIISYKTQNGNTLSAEEIANFSDVVRDADGVLEQVWNLWDGLANVENVSANAYTIALYLPNQVGEKDSQTGKYSVSGAPFKTFSISFSGGELSVSELDSRTGAIAFLSKCHFENGAWNQSQGSGDDEIFTTRSRAENPDGTWTLTTTKTRGANGVPASCVAEIFETTNSGNLCISRTEGAGTDSAQTTNFEHDSVGRVVKETRPGGSEIRTGYDNKGRVSARYEPFAGA